MFLHLQCVSYTNIFRRKTPKPLYAEIFSKYKTSHKARNLTKKQVDREEKSAEAGSCAD